MQELRWLLEELRVSFFAQELRTPQPVSVKRLDKVWAQLPQPRARPLQRGVQRFVLLGEAAKRTTRWSKPLP
jgi:hypothetical protein